MLAQFAGQDTFQLGGDGTGSLRKRELTPLAQLAAEHYGGQSFFGRELRWGQCNRSGQAINLEFGLVI